MMTAQTHKSIEIDLNGVELEGIKLFVQEGESDTHGMSLGTVPPCIPCVHPPCVAPCSSATSIAPPRVN